MTTYASVCSGVEAASLAWHGEPLCWEPQFFAEIEPFPSAVLAHHWPRVPNLGDFTTIRGEDWRGLVDVLVAGTPCQAFSVAGLRGSLDDARGNLTLSFVELAHAADPWCVVWENVPGVLSTDDNAFGCFLAGLVGAPAALTLGAGQRWTNAGMVAGPRRSAAWRILDAQYFGVPQRRRRVFVVSFRTRDRLNPGAVLFEPEGVRRDPTQGGEAWEDVARCLTSCSQGSGGARFSSDETLIPTLSTRCGDGSGQELGSGALVWAPLAFDTTQITHPENRSQPRPGRPCHPLAAEGHPPAVAFCIKGAAIGRQPENGPQFGEVLSDGSAYTLNCSEVHAVSVATDSVVAFHNRQDPDSGPVTHALGAKDNGLGVQSGAAVRRLTPLECERLQGMPDQHTRVPRGKGWAPDGPRYRAIGNSFAVPCVRWIGERIQRVRELAGLETESTRAPGARGAEGG